MKAFRLMALTPLLSLLSSAAPTAFQAGDDFTDPSRDVSKWGAADPTTLDAGWAEGGGVLSFVAPTASFGLNQSFRIWAGTAPDFTTDWVASVDIQIGTLTLQEGQGVTLGIDVANGADQDDRVETSLQIFSPDGTSVFRQVEADAYAGGSTVMTGNATVTSRAVQLQVSYDAHSRMLSAGFSVGGGAVKTVAAWDADRWSMRTGSTFQLSLDGRAFGPVVSSGQVVADNFQIRQQAPRALGTLAGGDDFNDNARSAANWGPMDSVWGGALLEEAGAGVRYSIPGSAGSEDDRASRLWYAGAGATDKGWTAQVDVALPALTLLDGNEVELGLVVLNQDDPGDRVALSLDLSSSLGSLTRQFHGGIRRDGIAFTDNDLLQPTASTSAALRVRWDAVQKKLFLDYDADGGTGGYAWVNLGAYAVNDGDSSWGLAGGTRFQVGLFAESYRGTVIGAAAGVRFDNFQVTSEQAPPAPLVIAPVHAAGTKLKVAWTGGRGPFQVQRRDTVAAGAWANVGASTASSEALVDMTGPRGFIRVLDLGQ